MKKSCFPVKKVISRMLLCAVMLTCGCRCGNQKCGEEIMSKTEAREILAKYQAKADRMKEAVLNSTDMTNFKGTCYYVSADGNDDNDGLTSETAFRTIDRVKQIKFKSGDAVLFRRGDLFRGNGWWLNSNMTIAAYGKGPKPTICGSIKNYADPSLWVETEHKGIWRCTDPIRNAGLVTFDHDPTEVGNYDVKLGTLVTTPLNMEGGEAYTFPEPPPLHLKNDLEFWSHIETKTLYLKSDENPGKRFKNIEIAPGEHIICFYGETGITIDNLHLTLTGRNAISGDGGNKDIEVKNCVIDYIGGTVLWQEHPFNPKLKNIRFGNAVEIFGSCENYKVHDNWIYQIYDTAITHQCNDTPNEVTMKDVEYWDNLIEYCYWSIEYYNFRNKHNITKDVYVHDNFCRFGGEGWGCRIRKKTVPMYAINFDTDECENYLTENNVFQFSTGYFIRVDSNKNKPKGFTFRRNTYIQKEGGNFSRICGEETSFSNGAKLMKELFGEEDACFITIPND